MKRIHLEEITACRQRPTQSFNALLARVGWMRGWRWRGVEPNDHNGCLYWCVAYFLALSLSFCLDSSTWHLAKSAANTRLHVFIGFEHVDHQIHKHTTHPFLSLASCSKFIQNFVFFLFFDEYTSIFHPFPFIFSAKWVAVDVSSVFSRWLAGWPVRVFSFMFAVGLLLGWIKKTH